MNRDRLRRLITVLKAVPGQEFNMRAWGHRHGCRTTCCALGWAGLDPGFQAEGLVSEWMDEQIGDKLLVISFHGEMYLEAAQQFFGLSQQEARWLFLPVCYPQVLASKVTTLDVISRVRWLLAGQPAGPQPELP